MKRLAATLALGLLVALLVGTGVASAAGTAGQDSATGHVTDATMIALVPQPCTPIPVPPFCIPQQPRPEVVATADVDFSARSSFNGTNPTGSAKFTFRNEDPDQVFTGEVTCLNVQADTATLSGPITESRGGSTLTVGTQPAFEPRSFVITAVDSGKGTSRPDFIGFELSPQTATDFNCAVPTRTSQVREGEVVIKDSLG